MSGRPAVEPPDLPAGLTFRPATMDDAPAVTDLVAACERADHGDSSISLEDLMAFWRRPSVDLGTMTMLVLDGDRIVGDAELFGTRAEVFVHPEARGRGSARPSGIGPRGWPSPGFLATGRSRSVRWWPT